MQHLDDARRQQAQQKVQADVYSTDFLTPQRAMQSIDLLVFYTLCASAVVGTWLYCARGDLAEDNARKLRAGWRPRKFAAWQAVNMACVTIGMSLHTMKVGGGDNVPVADVVAYAVGATLHGLLAPSVLRFGELSVALMCGFFAFFAGIYSAWATSETGHLSAYAWLASVVITFVLVFIVGRAWVLVEMPKALDELGDFAGSDKMREVMRRLDPASAAGGKGRRTVVKKVPKRHK